MAELDPNAFDQALKAAFSQRSEMEELMYIIRLTAEEVGLPFVRIHQAARAMDRDDYEVAIDMPDGETMLLRLPGRLVHIEERPATLEYIRHELAGINQSWRMSVDFAQSAVDHPPYEVSSAAEFRTGLPSRTLQNRSFRFTKPDQKKLIRDLWTTLPRDWREVALLCKEDRWGDAWELAEDILVQMAAQHRDNKATQVVAEREANEGGDMADAFEFAAARHPGYSLADIRGRVRDAASAPNEYLSDAELDEVINDSVRRLQYRMGHGPPVLLDDDGPPSQRP